MRTLSLFSLNTQNPQILGGAVQNIQTYESLPSLFVGGGLLKGGKIGAKKLMKNASTTKRSLLRDVDVRDTLDRILKNKPKYPDKDGTVFKNKQSRLPSKPYGYYSEWTVDTPGLHHRGERRIVSGKGGERYYTSDHYISFTKIK